MNEANLDFATGQTMADLVDREISNMRRTPQPAPVQTKQIPDALLIEQLQDAALPSVVADERARQRMKATDPLAYQRHDAIGVIRR